MITRMESIEAELWWLRIILAEQTAERHLTVDNRIKPKIEKLETEKAALGLLNEIGD